MPETTFVGPIAVHRHRAPAASGRVPCVVLAHGFGATAASGLHGFAEAFAAAGIEALVLDYRGFGASRGEPRGVLDVRGQIEDYRTVIEHARSLPEVDPDRIAAWGCSFAGGHVLEVAAKDPRIAAVVAATAFTDGLAVIREGLRRDGPRPLLGLSVLAVRDIVARLRGGPRVMAPIASEPGGLGALTAPGALRAYEKIAGDDWHNEVAADVFLSLGLYRPVTVADKVRCPVLVQVADGDRSIPPAATVQAAEKAHAEVRHYDGDHFDIYPGGPAHEAVRRDQLAFLRRTLAVEPVAEV